MISDGTYLWLACYRDGVVQKIDPVAFTVLNSVTLSTGSGPVDCAFDGSSIWVTEGLLQQIARINPLTAQVTARVQTASFPRTLLWDGTNLWTPNNTNGATGYQNIQVSSPTPGGGLSNQMQITISGSDFNPFPFSA
jgi:streptogramin lyase